MTLTCWHTILHDVLQLLGESSRCDGHDAELEGEWKGTRWRQRVATKDRWVECGPCLCKERRPRFDIGEGDQRETCLPTTTRVFSLHTHANRYLRDAASSGNRTCETAGKAEERRCAIPARGGSRRCRPANKTTKIRHHRKQRIRRWIYHGREARCRRHWVVRRGGPHPGARLLFVHWARDVLETLTPVFLLI